MSQYNSINNQSAFTLIELLVTLTLLGLLLASAGPSLKAMLDSRLNNAAEQEIVAAVVALPLLAKSKQQAYVINSAELLDIRFGQYEFVPALKVSQSGYCSNAELHYQGQVKYLVKAPFCSVIKAK